MTYTPNVPQATQTIASTQGPIEANFQYINTAMRIDHAWNGNEINSQADGSHQKISLPNQPTDIASLGTGIASVIYAIGGNLFAYNGAKQPITGTVVTGSITYTASPQTVATLPADCIGFALFSNTGGTVNIPYAFASAAGVLYVQSATFWNAPVVTATRSSLALQVQRVTANQPIDFPGVYKIIYWAV